MAYNSLFTGRPEEIRQLPTMTPQQTGWANQVGTQAAQGLGATNLSFDPIKAERLKHFQSQTLPTLLDRLQSTRGSGNPFSSGSVLNALAGAGTDLESRLAAEEGQYNLNKYTTLLGGLGAGLKPQFETAISPETGGIWGQSAQGFGQALPMLALLSAFGNQGKTESSTGQSDAGNQNTLSSWLPYILKAIGAGGAGFLAGGPLGGAVGAGSQLLGGR